MKLLVGDKVKDFSFVDQKGQEHFFPQEFAEAKLALIFLRHLGCPLCKMTLEDLQKNLDRFSAKNINTAVVVQSTPARVASYAEKENITFWLVSDLEKKLYQNFEVNPGGIKEFMAPAALRATVRATLKGHLHGAFEGNEFQVPASFLLGPDSKILYAYYGRDISDFGKVEDILAKA
jgi:peroxiredoxin